MQHLRKGCQAVNASNWQGAWQCLGSLCTYVCGWTCPGCSTVQANSLVDAFNRQSLFDAARSCRSRVLVQRVVLCRQVQWDLGHTWPALPCPGCLQARSHGLLIFWLHVGLDKRSLSLCCQMADSVFICIGL